MENNNNNLPIYKYESLPPENEDLGHWIRVFDLLPSNQKIDQIVVRLRVILLAKVSPKRSCQYDTISYVWGEESENDEDVLIIHEDEPNPRGVLRLRKNLCGILRLLREQKARKIEYTLWADQLCINQNEDDDECSERSSQVALMGQVYWNCGRVQVWLGQEDSEYAEAAFEEMNNRSRDYWHNSHSCEDLTEDAVQNLDKKAWWGIAKLYEREWFQRVWVQQEIGLGNRATFWWGEHSKGVNKLVEFALWLQGRGKLAAYTLGISMDAVNTTAANWQNYGRHTDPGWWSDSKESKDYRSRITFLTLLVDGAKCKASVPRDYVFAFLGHPAAHRKQAYDPGKYMNYMSICNDSDQPPIIAPNYSPTYSLQQVYFDTAQALVRQHGDLALLGAVDHDNKTIQRNEFPSWIPRWHTLGNLEAIGIRKEKIGDAWRESSSLRMEIRPTDKALGVHASLLDEISSKAIHAEVVDGLGEGNRQAIQNYFVNHRGRFRKRVLFETNRLGWGLGPQILEVGDIVAFILGTYTPAILRPHGEDFKIVGMCSLPGRFMGKKATKLLQARECTQRDIWLV